MESAAFVLCRPVRHISLPGSLPVTVAWWEPLPALHCEILPDSSHCLVYLTLVSGKNSLKRSRVKKQNGPSFLERNVH